MALRSAKESKLGAPVALRALAIVHTCMYDAWAAYDDTAAGSWSSTQPSVATVSANGGLVSPVSVGALTVLVTVATPVNFHIQAESNPLDGSLFFTYAWSSSTGNQADLSACTVGESVYYPNFPTDPYTWPLPMVQTTPDPTVVRYPGTYQGGPDTNGAPNGYSTPYFAVSFSATQRFWWSCTNYNSGAIQTLAPDVTIVRSIFKDTDGFWKFRMTKSGYVGNAAKLPNQ